MQADISARLALYNKLKLYKEVGETVGFHISDDDYDMILGLLEPPTEDKGAPRQRVVFDRVAHAIDGETAATCMAVLVTMIASVMHQGIQTEEQLDESCALVVSQIRRHFTDWNTGDERVAQGGVRG
jgi:hypothetical protein